MSSCPISKACRKRQRRKENRKLRLIEINLSTEENQNIKMYIEKKKNNDIDYPKVSEELNIKMTSKMRRKILRAEKFGIHDKSVEPENCTKIEEKNDNIINKIKFLNKTLWCLHPDCLESIISFNSEDDLELHMKKEHSS